MEAKKQVTFNIDGFNFYFGLKRTKKVDPAWHDFYFFSNDLKENLIHHRSKPVLMIKNIRRFQSAVMPDTVSQNGKTYTIPEKWK